MNHWGKPRKAFMVSGDKTVAVDSRFAQTVGGRQMSKYEQLEKSRQNAKRHEQLKRMPVVRVAK